MVSENNGNEIYPAYHVGGLLLDVGDDPIAEASHSIRNRHKNSGSNGFGSKLISFESIEWSPSTPSLNRIWVDILKRMRLWLYPLRN